MKHRRTLLGMSATAVLGGLLLRHSVASGSVLATVVVGPLPRSLVVEVVTGRVFVSTVAQLGTIVVLDSTSGARLYAVALGVSQGESAMYAPYVFLAGTTGQYVRVGLQDGTQFDLSPTSGAVLQRWPAHYAWPPLPVGGHPVHGIASGSGNTLLVEDMGTRTVVRRLPIGQAVLDTEGVQQSQRLFLSSPTGALSIVDAYRGVILRTVQTAASYYPRFAVSVPTRHLFVLSDTDRLQMLDAVTGRVLRTSRAVVGAAPDATTPAFSHVFEASPRGDQLWVSDPARRTLSVFAATTGALLYTARVGPTPMAVAADPPHHHLLVLCRGPLDLSGNPQGYGSLSVLDSRTGRVVRTVQVGAAPVGLALDLRRSRAFVLNANRGADMLPLHLPAPDANLLGRVRHWLPFLPNTPAATDQGSVTVLDTSRL